MVKANGYEFHIIEDTQGALCTAIIDENGTHILAQIMLKNKGANDADLELRGKKVRITTSPNYKDTNKDGSLAKSISGLCVCVVG